MEFAFTPLRIAFLLACLGTFAALGGFTPPTVHFDGEMVAANSNRAWVYCVLMFLGGAALATVIDHWVGMMPPTSLRLLYVIGGVVTMVVSTLWYRSLLTTWAEQLGGI